METVDVRRLRWYIALDANDRPIGWIRAADTYDAWPHIPPGAGVKKIVNDGGTAPPPHKLVILKGD